MKRWFLMLFFVCSAGAQASQTERETLQTSSGTLAIACEERIMFGECILKLGEKVLLDDDLRLSFDASAGATDPYYLVQVLSGSVACPAMFFIVDLHDPRAPQLSSEFGTCAESATVSMDGKGEMRIVLPLWQEEGTARWSYKDGKLKRLK